MALGGKVIDFGRLNFLNNTNEIGGVGEVTVVQKKARSGKCGSR